MISLMEMIGDGTVVLLLMTVTTIAMVGGW